MGDEFDAGKFGAVVGLPFGVANAVTAQTNTDLTASDATYVNTLFVMPAGGSVVGISVQASAAVTVASAIFRAHKDGTEYAIAGYPAPTLDTTNTQQSYASIRPGVLTFSAGEGLGVSYTSTTNMAPTNTNDFTAVLWVQLDPN